MILRVYKTLGIEEAEGQYAMWSILVWLFAFISQYFLYQNIQETYIDNP